MLAVPLTLRLGWVSSGFTAAGGLPCLGAVRMALSMRVLTYLRTGTDKGNPTV